MKWKHVTGKFNTESDKSQAIVSYMHGDSTSGRIRE